MMFGKNAFLPSVSVLIALLTTGFRACADTLRADDVMNPTNIDWMALARAQKTVRLGGKVQFIWPTYPASSYLEIRRTLWLAALHGILDQTCPDERTHRLMTNELAVARNRLEKPVVFDIAIRDVSTADRLLPRLVTEQSACLLIGPEENSELPTTFRCNGDEVTSERTDITFSSLAMTVTFARACQPDDSLVLEEDGRIAKDIFVRRFKDGSATVVNLTSSLRRDMCYLRRVSHLTFDLPPCGIVHLSKTAPPRMSRNLGENFSSGLWQIIFEGTVPPRLIRPQLLPSAVNENYYGTLLYRTDVQIPTGEEAILLLHLEVEGAETEVSINGRSLGVHAWEPFEWEIPPEFRGKNLPIEIRLEKRTLTGFMQTPPRWHRR